MLVLPILLFASGMSSAGDASIIVARIGRQTFTGDFICPEGDICLRYPARTRLSHVRTVAGSPVAKRVSARIWLHGRLASGVRLALIVQPRGSGLEVREWVSIERGRACFSGGIVGSLKLTPTIFLAGPSDTLCLDVE